MKTHALRLIHKTRQYLMRKKRTNAAVKAGGYAYKLVVSKSNTSTQGQIVDASGKVVFGSADRKCAGETRVQKAKALGVLLAKKCQEKGIEKLAFDRNGYLYHGKVKAVAEGLREGGILL